MGSAGCPGLGRHVGPKQHTLPSPLVSCAERIPHTRLDPSRALGSLTRAWIPHARLDPSRALGSLTRVWIPHTRLDPSHAPGSLTRAWIPHARLDPTYMRLDPVATIPECGRACEVCAILYIPTCRCVRYASRLPARRTTRTSRAATAAQPARLVGTQLRLRTLWGRRTKNTARASVCFEADKRLHGQGGVMGAQRGEIVGNPLYNQHRLTPTKI